jgi:hypothetical protein
MWAGLTMTPACSWPRDVVLVGSWPTVLGADQHVHVGEGTQRDADVDAVGLEVGQRHEDAGRDGDGRGGPCVAIHRCDGGLQGLADLWHQAQWSLQRKLARW